MERNQLHNNIFPGLPIKINVNQAFLLKTEIKLSSTYIRLKDFQGNLPKIHKNSLDSCEFEQLAVEPRSHSNKFAENSRGFLAKKIERCKKLKFVGDSGLVDFSILTYFSL